jgi:drug/metabolite transporter (DMT)-like permease
MLTRAGGAVLLAAAGYSLSAITVRIVNRTDSLDSQVFYLMLFVGIGASVLAWPQWVPLRAQDTWVLCLVAVTGFLGQLCITEAFRKGEASAIAPFEYSALAWGLAIDWLLWQTLPDAWMLAGAAIIVASGVYLVRHESVHAESEHP